MRKGVAMSAEYPPEPPGTCSECDRMWRQYAFATAEHLTLIRKREAAIAADDPETEAMLAAEIAPAERRRQRCREDIRVHEAEQHAERLQVAAPQRAG